MARSAQTHKSISFIWIVWSTLYVYLCLKPRTSTLRAYERTVVRPFMQRSANEGKILTFYYCLTNKRSVHQLWLIERLVGWISICTGPLLYESNFVDVLGSICVIMIPRMVVFIWSIFIRSLIDHMNFYNLNWPKIKWNILSFLVL